MKSFAAMLGFAASASSKRRGKGLSSPELDRIYKEIDQVSQYIAGVRREIGLLRANEIYRDRLPDAKEDLSSIKLDTAKSANRILTAAEAILASDKTTLDDYRADVEVQVMTIFEACEFQDLAGQRVERIDETLAAIAKRLQRFVLAVKATDAGESFDRAAIEREARRNILMVEGPQALAAGIDQRAIDNLFD